MGTEANIWDQVIAILRNNAVTPSYWAQLRLARTQGSADGFLFLEVDLKFTHRIIMSLRLQIIEAFKQIPEASNLNDITVINLEEVPELSETPKTAAPEIAKDPTPVNEVKPINPWGHTETAKQAETAAAPVTVNPAAPAIRPQNIETRAVTPNLETQLNPKHTFDSFVIGQTNNLAHAAALAVAEAPGNSYNPLFIYGSSGLGKTHLLHAIGNHALELNPDLKVRYVNAEDFTNDYINSISQGRGQEFNTRWREYNVLLVDDVQFFSGKMETQETFFHTFNAMHDSNRQVVLTSDVQPRELQGFEERLLSRFTWGLSTDIHVPDLETRIAILQKKAQRDDLQFSNDVLEYIASKITSNIRELEGSLLRVTAFASLHKEDVTLELVQTALKGSLPDDAAADIQPQEIIDACIKYFGVSNDELTGPGRSKDIAFARQVAMYLCRELTSLSLPKIGSFFGGRDHSTVLHATKKISQLLGSDAKVYTTISELTTRIKSPGK
ncbi:chromosomal replication initiator protein DnaA [Canibacter zhoujuaniae]|uniref:chromosomal replication initiator protein DnaA n=1 Tax=Canibacter zhoujuaniae TaxID=2708343 RepID=UPI001FBB6B45|nr:chromosomal replication initiator protein DnaA [Canibacter zhoujuaniae]